MTEEIESSVERALARIEAKPGFRLTCWSCGHEAEATLGDPQKREYRCDECGAVTAYGEPMPRVTITPYVDRRFIVTKYDLGPDKTGVDIVLARGYAAELALEILSVTEPSAYRALQRIFAARTASGSPPGTKEDSRAGSGAAIALDSVLGEATRALEDLGKVASDSGRNPGSVPDPMLP